MFNIKCLFLHHNMDDVTLFNFKSFTNYNNNIVPIHDYDKSGIPGSYIVKKDAKFQRPTVISTFQACDIPYINYAYDNIDNDTVYTHYLFCEYDCLCRCNINELLKKYEHNDVTVSQIKNIVTCPSWCWFKNLKKCNFVPMGLVPTAFTLVKKEALKQLIKLYETHIKDLESANSEGRFGTLAKYLNLNICEYESNIQRNITHHVIKFKGDSLIYHPSKGILDDSYFIGNGKSCNTAMNGSWTFIHLNRDEKKILGTIMFNSNGLIDVYNNYNEVFWEVSGEMLCIKNLCGVITSTYNKINDNEYIGDMINNKVVTKNYFLLKRQKC